MHCEKSFLVTVERSQNASQTHSFHLTDAFFENVEGSVIEGGNIAVQLQVNKQGDEVKLSWELTGEIVLQCDRCLGALQLPVYLEGEQSLSLTDEEETLIQLTKQGYEINLGWLLYETLVLSLPLVKQHQEGACNTAMEELLAQYLVAEETPFDKKDNK